MLKIENVYIFALSLSPGIGFTGMSDYHVYRESESELRGAAYSGYPRAIRSVQLHPSMLLSQSLQDSQTDCS